MYVEAVGLHLHGKHIPSLIAIVNVVVQNLFGHSTRTWCNTNLRSYKLSMNEFYMEGSKTMLCHEAQLYTSLPMDLRTARKNLNIEGDITIHATCPKCRCVYPPIMNGGMPHAGRLLVISSPVRTEIHVVPDGMYTAEVNYMNYQSVSINISITIPNQVPI